MDEIGFKIWLLNKGKNRKMTSDMISRIKRVERELSFIDVDEEYQKDGGKYLLSLFLHTGKNREMDKHYSNLPIGKTSMNAYKYAIKNYIDYKNNIK